MPCIKPVSDLRNYNEVLQCVAEGEPVYLTKNGRGAYAVLTIDDYERLSTAINLNLYSKIAEGLKDIEAGRTAPFDKAMSDIRKELDI